MNKAIWLSLFLIMMLVPSMVLGDISITPSTITEELGVSETKLVQITLTNNDNETVNVNIVSKDTSMVKPGVDNIDLDADESFSFFLVLTGDLGASLRNTGVEIVTDETKTIPIQITTGIVSSGYLEPSFLKFKQTYEQNTRDAKTLILRNRFNQRVELRDMALENVVNTAEGIKKPIDVQGNLGWLEPSQDLSLKIDINTEGLKLGSYTPKLLLSYYVDGNRRIQEINFEIGVVKGIPDPNEEPKEEDLKKFNIGHFPEIKKVGDYITVEIRDSDSTFIQRDAIVKIIVRDASTKQETNKFIYSSPFLTEDSEYCIVVEDIGYKPLEECFAVTEATGKIVTNPSKIKSGDATIIKVVNAEGRLVEGTIISIGGTTYDTNDLSYTFQTGEYTVRASAPGYKIDDLLIDLKEPATIIAGLEQTTKVGNVLTFTLNREADWTVYENTTVILTGSGNNITFTPTTEAQYSLIADGKELHSVSITGGSVWALPGGSLSTMDWVIVLAILGTIYYIFSRGKKSGERKGKVGYGVINNPDPTSDM